MQPSIDCDLSRRGAAQIELCRRSGQFGHRAVEEGVRVLPVDAGAALQVAQPRGDDRHGRVTSVLPEFAPDAARDVAYLCGNPEMVDACFALLKDAGLPIPHIRREKYVSPPDPKARVLAMAPGEG